MPGGICKSNVELDSREPGNVKPVALSELFHMSLPN